MAQKADAERETPSATCKLTSRSRKGVQIGDPKNLLFFLLVSLEKPEKGTIKKRSPKEAVVNCVIKPRPPNGIPRQAANR